MTASLIGTVLEVNLGTVTIEDSITKEVIICEVNTNDILDIKVGEQAIFVGQMNNGVLKVKRHEIRKFLDPLYEEDLFDASGRFTLIHPVDNPFTETFIQFLEKQKELDELTSNETSSP